MSKAYTSVTDPECSKLLKSINIESVSTWDVPEGPMTFLILNGYIRPVKPKGYGLPQYRRFLRLTRKGLKALKSLA